MANKKITDLTELSFASNLDLLAIVSDGETKKINALNLKTERLRIAEHTIIPITTTQTLSLGSVVSVNALIIANPGLTLTVQFPLSPIEGQIAQFSTLTNTVTLVVGNAAGTGNITPSFAGAPTAGFKATYVYHIEDDTWYLIG